MAKAKLVTRSATTSTVTDDNLNKASALTHAEMDSNLINLRDSSFGIADDSSTVLQVTHDKTITVAGAGTVGTALSGDTLTITGSGITATSTDTLTNKTFNANGTGNSISNIETADIAAGTLVTAAEGIGSNNNDTTIPTSAAVKAYADSVGGGGSATGLTFVGDDSTGTLISDGETVKIAGGTGITTAMSGDTLTITASGGGGTITALNNQAENRLVSTIGSTTTELDGEANLTFDGSTLTLTGSAALDGVTIADNLITTNRSNDDLRLSANGTGKISMGSDDFYGSNPQYEDYFGNTDLNKIAGIRYDQTVDANTAARAYGLGISLNTTVTGSSSTNSNFRQRGINAAIAVDMAGYDYTRSGTTRGPTAGSYATNITNSSSTPSTINQITGASNFAAAYADSGTYAAGDLTITNATANSGAIELYSDPGAGDFTITNGYAFKSEAFIDGSNDTVTNMYGFYHGASSSQTGTITNNYAFYDATNSLSVFGDIQTQAVSITDNVISTNRSNDDLIINSSGTGRITISTDGTRIEDSATYSKYQGNPAFVKGVVLSHELTTNPDTLTSREYGHSIHMGNTLTASSSTNSNFRPRSCIFSSQTDMAGYDYTVAGLSRGPVGLFAAGTVNNSSATTASTLATVRAASITTGCSDYDSATQDLTITNAIVVQGAVEIDHNGEGDVTITNGYNFYAEHGAYADSTGAATITNNYGFYYTGSDATNRYAFWDAANVLSRFGAVILANQAGDPSGVTDSAHIYAKDDAGSSEVYVRDEAGNVTKISPHNDAGEWEYYSVNKNTGKKVRVNMERMIKRLEEITGETFIESE
jgi:hypothetical protein